MGEGALVLSEIVIDLAQREIEMEAILRRQRGHVARQRLDHGAVRVALGKMLGLGERAVEFGPARRQRDRPFQRLPRLVEPAQGAQHGAAAMMRLGKAGGQRQRLLGLRQRLVMPAEQLQRRAEIIVRRSRAGLERHRPAVMHCRLLIAVQRPQGGPQIVLRLGIIGLDRQRPMVVVDGLRIAAERL